MTGLVDDIVHVRARFTERADIHVARVSLQGGTGKIVVSGTAETRTALLELQALLRADSKFSMVELPVGDLTGKDNSFPFTITVTPKADPST